MNKNFAPFMKEMLKLTSGCTEPAAVALNAAYAGKALGAAVPDVFELVVDELTFKNAFNAGIPLGKEKKGAQWAALLGYAVADPDKGLEVFTALDEEKHLLAERIRKESKCDVRVVEKSGLYISSETRKGDRTVRVTTEGEHTNITELIIDGVRAATKGASAADDGACSDFGDCYDPGRWAYFADILHADAELMSLVRKGIEVNLKASEHGRRYDGSDDDYGVAGAIFARMNGDDIPVMSVSGSGNKGLASIIPAYKYAVAAGAGREEAEKAVLVAILATSLVTKKFGAVSSVCGVVYGAGTGVLAAMMYSEHELEDFETAYRNYISSVGGVFCDGAKGSCALKASAAVIMAKRARELTKAGFVLDGKDGYLGSDFLETLNNLIRYNEHFALFDKSTIDILKDKS